MDAAHLGATTPRRQEPQFRVDVAVETYPELADLWSIFGDLLVASMAAHHVHDPRIQDTGLTYLRRACWEAAIISYARCFQQGQSVVKGRTRTTLEPFLDALPAALRKCHDQILALRDKRIGHHVALQSGQEVSIYLGGDAAQGGDIQMTDVFVHVETELYDVELLRDLERLTQLLRGRVGTRVDELRKKVYEEAREEETEVIKALGSGSEWSPKDLT